MPRASHCRLTNAGRMLRFGAALSALVLAGLIASDAGESYVAGSASTRVVELVPLGNFPTSVASSLARTMTRRFHVPVRASPRVAIPESTSEEFLVHEPARQLVGRVPKNAILIGLTELYIQDPLTHQVIFEGQLPPRLGLISAARLDGRSDGIPHDPALLLRRLTKLVVRSIEILRFGYRFNDIPRSVLYDKVTDTEAIDVMTDQLAPGADPNWNWATAANNACGTATTDLDTYLVHSRPKSLADVEDYVLQSETIETVLYRALKPIPINVPAAEPPRLVAAVHAVVSAEAALAAAIGRHKPQATIAADAKLVQQDLVRARIAADEADTNFCSYHYQYALSH